MFRRVLVGDNERVLLIRNKRLSDILAPGEYWIFTLGRGIALERFGIQAQAFTSEWADHLVSQKPELTARYFTVIETSDSQVAIVYLDGKLARVIGPGKRVLFWRGAVNVAFTAIDARETPEVPRELLPALARLGSASGATFTTVDEGKRGLVYIDGRKVRELQAGTYGFWNVASTVRVDVLEVRRQTLEVTGQEILTKDKVTIRVNVSAVYEVADVTAANQGVQDVRAYLYRALQVAVRQSLGKRTLEEALAEKTDIDDAVSAEIRSEMQAYGVRVGAIALKDIILPGDIRDILNQVVTAEKQAQANLIRRREETAATRSLLNTAKLMEENPLLVRLKELETLEKVAEKIDKITVVGGLPALLEKTVMLRPE